MFFIVNSPLVLCSNHKTSQGTMFTPVGAEPIAVRPLHPLAWDGVDVAESMGWYFMIASLRHQWVLGIEHA